MSSPYEPTAAEIAAYIDRVLGGLHQLAEQHRDLAMLAYLLEVARQEAEARAKRPG